MKSPDVAIVTLDSALSEKTIYRARVTGKDGRQSLWLIWRPAKS
jgi:hypothetical protein